MPNFRRLLSVVMLLVMASSLARTPALAQTTTGPTATQTPMPPDPVAELMAQLSPEQKIGQLFLVSFGGSDTGQDSDISKLIREQHIGGVVLLSSNGNFANNADTPRQVAGLASALQKTSLENNAGIPLFVAVDHEGDGFPYTRITGGLTQLPNPMAIGATWDPKNAAAVGEVAGKELEALGINLLFGPDVDVLNNPRSTGRGDIGTRTFGGDPWWVAQMGRSYVCGVHQGSGGKVATVAKHFPGHGGSDRLPDQEVATVDKSLTELKRIELTPFFGVTQAQGADDCAVIEAMMTSHIRYRGFQGNIRQFTAPISFDAESLSSILGLPEFATWQRSGLMVSDSLGVEAVARYFDPTGRTFPHRQIAKEALMAGNDLLTISEFARPQATSLQYANLVDTVNYFREEYTSNPSFRQRVEDAAARVLQVKLKLYGGRFEANSILVDPGAASKATGGGEAIVNKIARESLTLLYPNGATSRARPAPPRRDENILIFVDSQRVKDCPLDSCEWYEPMPVNVVQDTILRLYGPAGSRQIDPSRVQSVSFADLKTYLEGRLSASAAVTTTTVATPEPGKPDLAKLLNEADWVIFAMRNADGDPASNVVRVFLDSGLDLPLDTKLAVLAFNLPYYLDTTEINKLSLYLAAYSKMPPFIEAAVRALFGEFVPTGHSPVNVEGVSYDLLRQLAPDPNRPFALTLQQTPTGQSALPPVTVKLRAGPVIDRNGNRVPDGTEIVFEATYEGGVTYMPAVHGATVDGCAEATLTLREPGSVLISARSGEATSSMDAHVSVEMPPTATATSEPMRTTPPTHTPSDTPTLVPTATPTPTPTAAGGLFGNGPAAGRVAGLLLALLGAGLSALAGAGWLAMHGASPVTRLRGVLIAFSAGLAGYILYLLWLKPLWPLPINALLMALLSGLIALPLANVVSGARTRLERP